MIKYHGFSNLDDVKKQFESPCDDLKEYEVVIASYGSQCYDGEAIVIIERDNKLFTSEGAHCSCYGLENQWEMVETTKEILKKRIFEADYHPELVEFLKNW